MKSENIREVEVRPYNLKQLAELYKISRHTMRVWIARISTQIGRDTGTRIFTKKQVEIIFQILGRPE